MKPKTKYISQAVVRSKWVILPEAAQLKAGEILHSIELPVLAKYTSDQKKIEAQRIVQSLIQMWVLQGWCVYLSIRIY